MVVFGFFFGVHFLHGRYTYLLQLELRKHSHRKRAMHLFLQCKVEGLRYFWNDSFMRLNCRGATNVIRKSAQHTVHCHSDHILTRNPCLSKSETHKSFAQFWLFILDLAFKEKNVCECNIWQSIKGVVSWRQMPTCKCPNREQQDIPGNSLGCHVFPKSGLWSQDKAACPFPALCLQLRSGGSGLLPAPILVQSRYQRYVWEGGREKYPAIL